MVVKLLAALLLLNALTLTARAQRPGGVLSGASGPNVRLSFERRGDDESVWLRLHNDTPWAISFRTENRHSGADVTPLVLGDGRQVPGLADNLEVMPEYFIERAAEGVTTSDRFWCYSSTSWLPPGRSVVFSFPAKDFKSWERLYVQITYEWESENSGVEHRVKFQGSELNKPR